MLGRIITICAIMAASSIAIGSRASRPADNEVRAEAVDHTNDNWTTPSRVEASGPPSASASRPSEVRLGRSGDSHFYADVDVDGTNVRMLVDSGASVVALTRRDAEAIGINVDSLPVGGTAKTAGGDVEMRVVMLDSVNIDGIEVRRVEAAVIDADMGVSLLGQSYLSKLEAVNVEGDTMTLR